MLLGIFGGVYGALFCKVSRFEILLGIAANFPTVGQHLVDQKRPQRHLTQAASDRRGAAHHAVCPSAEWVGGLGLTETLLYSVTVCISFYNPWTRLGGTELVYELFSGSSPTSEPFQCDHLLNSMNVECHTESSSPGGLCIDMPEQVWGLVASIGFALVAKALLTVVTFGIKLPGTLTYHLNLLTLVLTFFFIDSRHLHS